MSLVSLGVSWCLLVAWEVQGVEARVEKIVAAYVDEAVVNR